jgi:hypothetical protein
VRIRPYPFAESPAPFELVRRVIPRGRNGGVLATPSERVAITFE